MHPSLLTNSSHMIHPLEKGREKLQTGAFVSESLSRSVVPTIFATVRLFSTDIATENVLIVFAW